MGRGCAEVKRYTLFILFAIENTLLSRAINYARGECRIGTLGKW